MFERRRTNLESMSEADKARAAERGRRWLLGVIAAYGLLALASSIGDIVFRDGGALAAVARLVLVGVLFGLMYAGYSWARYLMAILFLVSAAFAGALFFTDAPAGPKALAAVFAVLFVAGFGILGFAKPILFYEHYRRDRRRSG